jgi:hypothetical protein
MKTGTKVARSYEWNEKIDSENNERYYIKIKVVESS